MMTVSSWWFGRQEKKNVVASAWRFIFGIASCSQFFIKMMRQKSSGSALKPVKCFTVNTCGKHLKGQNESNQSKIKLYRFPVRKIIFYSTTLRAGKGANNFAVYKKNKKNIQDKYIVMCNVCRS